MALDRDWKNFPDKALMGVHFQKEQGAELIYWTSANPDTTAEMCGRLIAAEIPYSHKPHSVWTPNPSMESTSPAIGSSHVVERLEIETRPNLEKFVAAGGKFATSIHYERSASPTTLTR